MKREIYKMENDVGKDTHPWLNHWKRHHGNGCNGQKMNTHNTITK